MGRTQERTAPALERVGRPADRRADDGVVLRVRPGTDDDAPALAAMLRGLSPEAAFHRFLAGFGAPKPALLRGLLSTDARRGALLATVTAGGEEHVVGHACWIVDPHDVVDLGVVVTDVWQRRGLGHRLVAAALARAAAVGARSLHLDIHPQNRAVIGIVADRTPPGSRSFGDGLVRFDVPLAALAATL